MTGYQRGQAYRVGRQKWENGKPENERWTCWKEIKVEWSGLNGMMKMGNLGMSDGRDDRIQFDRVSRIRKWCSLLIQPYYCIVLIMTSRARDLLSHRRDFIWSREFTENASISAVRICLEMNWFGLICCVRYWERLGLVVSVSDTKVSFVYK